MSVRTEQNWRWSYKTFPPTFCVVSTSEETIHCSICLTFKKNLHWALGREGGGVELRPNIGFFGTINLSQFRLQKLNTTQPSLLYMLKSEKFYIT